MSKRTVIVFFMAALSAISCTGPVRKSGAPLRVRAHRRPWPHAAGTGDELTSKHYRIFTSAKHRSLLDVLPGFLEGAYANYIKITGLENHRDDKRMDVYMLASRDQWAHLSTQLFGPNASHTAIAAGGYSYKGVGVYWDLGGRSTLAIAAHEGLHQFLFHRMQNRLPLCIEEGLATNAEGYHIEGITLASGVQGALGTSVMFMPGHNPQRLGALTKVINSSTWTKTDHLLEMNAADYLAKGHVYTLGWYGQVWAMMRFIQSKPQYRRGLHKMLADARDGNFHLALGNNPQFRGITHRGVSELQRSGKAYNKTFAKALFQHYIASDLELFDRQCKAFCHDLVAMPSSR